MPGYQNHLELIQLMVPSDGFGHQKPCVPNGKNIYAQLTGVVQAVQRNGLTKCEQGFRNGVRQRACGGKAKEIARLEEIELVIFPDRHGHSIRHDMRAGCVDGGRLGADLFISIGCLARTDSVARAGRRYPDKCGLSLLLSVSHIQRTRRESEDHQLFSRCSHINASALLVIYFRDRNAVMEKVLETSSSGQACLDDYLLIVSANSKLGEIFGYQAEELLGHRLFDLFATSDGEKLRNLIDRMRAEGGREGNYELDICGATGRALNSR